MNLELNQNIQEKGKDPFELKLRDQLVKKNNLEYLGSFSEEGLAVAKEKNKFHLINGSEIRTIIDRHDKDEFKKKVDEGFVIENSSLGIGKSYYMNRTGNKISDSFDEVKPFSEGMGLVRKGDFEDGKCIFVDINGSQCIQEEYEDANPFQGGMAEVKQNNKWYLINKKGEKINKKESETSQLFMHGLGYQIKGNEVSFINKTGKEVTVEELADIGFLSSPAYFNLEKAKELEKQGFDPNETNRFQQGVTSLRNKNDKSYLFDDKYRMLSNDGFDQIYPFGQEGVSFARNNNDWFLIDTKAKKLKTFGAVQPFNEGVAYVYTKEKPGDWFYIDPKGDKIF